MVGAAVSMCKSGPRPPGEAESFVSMETKATAATAGAGATGH